MSLTPEQLAIRRTGLGGSEIAAIMGEMPDGTRLSRFLTPFDVWLSKVHGYVQPPNDDMARGTHLEDGIARWYAERVGVTPEALLAQTTCRHPTRPVAVCTPDRVVLNFTPEGRDRLLSIKSPRRGYDWGEDGTDDVPEEYVLQLQWEWAILSALRSASSGVDAALDSEMHLAALVDGDLRIYRIQSHPETQAYALDFAERWWARHVVGGEQPSMEGSTSARDWLRARFPRDTGVTREATAHETRLLIELDYAKGEEKRATAVVETLENELKASMGDASRIEAPGLRATWKADKNGKRSFKLTKGQ